MEAADVHRRQLGPLVVGAPEEGDGEHDEAEHETDVSGLERRAEEQAERRHRQARERDQSHEDPPVEAQVRLDARGVHHGRDREDQEGGEEALRGRGQDPATATIQIGQGACTRSSISRVKPNSCAMGSATA